MQLARSCYGVDLWPEDSESEDEDLIPQAVGWSSPTAIKVLQPLGLCLVALQQSRCARTYFILAQHYHCQEVKTFFWFQGPDQEPLVAHGSQSSSPIFSPCSLFSISDIRCFSSKSCTVRHGDFQPHNPFFRNSPRLLYALFELEVKDLR